jgi:hypothetical protein
MNERRRDAYVNLCRDTIRHVTSRMDALRSMVERLPFPTRADIERELDRIRGLLNRAVARTEAARFADDTAWEGVRTQIEGAFSILERELGALESRLPRVPA